MATLVCGVNIGHRHRGHHLVPAAEPGLGDDQVGWAGARQRITEGRAAPAREAGEKIEDDGTAHERVVAFLEQLKVI